MSEVDDILKQGDQFHTVFNASLGRKTGGKLALDELEDSIKRIVGKDETQFGDILANEPRPPFSTLEVALHQAKEAAGALLRVGEYTTAVQINSDNSVRLFDPHAQDDFGFVSGSGKAIIIDFKDIDAFHCYLKRFVKSNGTGHSTNTDNDSSSVPCTCRSFELMPLFVKSKDCLQNVQKLINQFVNSESR